VKHVNAPGASVVLKTCKSCNTIDLCKQACLQEPECMSIKFTYPNYDYCELNSNVAFTTVYTETYDLCEFSLSGVVSNRAVSSLTSEGFSVCYQAVYSSVTFQCSSLASSCGGSNPNAFVFVGALQSAGATSFSIGAFAKASDVFTTTSSTSTAYLHNGAYWYCYNGHAFGFADSSVVNLNSYYGADVLPGANRLSWNIGNGYGGYRAGDNNLNFDDSWQKVIYIKY